MIFRKIHGNKSSSINGYNTSSVWYDNMLFGYNISNQSEQSHLFHFWTSNTQPISCTCFIIIRTTRRISPSLQVHFSSRLVYECSPYAQLFDLLVHVLFIQGASLSQAIQSRVWSSSRYTTYYDLNLYWRSISSKTRSVRSCWALARKVGGAHLFEFIRL